MRDKYSQTKLDNYIRYHIKFIRYLMGWRGRH